MIILDATTKSLQFKLSGAITTSQLPFAASYVDTTGTATTPGEQDGVSNNTTAVTVVSSPASSTQRLVKNIIVQNADTVSATVTIIYNNNSTLRNIFIATLKAGYQLTYEDGYGWAVFDTNGGLVSNASAVATVLVSQGGTGLTSLTSHAVLLGEGTSNVGFATVGTAGRLLVDQGASADPAFEIMSGDATLASSGAVALATVNSNVGSFTNANITVNAKGLVTAAANGSGGGGGSGTAAIPQGRLTLVSGTPVPTSDQTAKGTIYYDQYAGNLVPNYNGSADANLTITGGEVSLVLDATNHLSGKIYDIFAIANGSAVRLVTGPAWTNTTTRSSALDFTTRGYITNASSLTHAYNNSTDYGPVSANQGTYIGSLYATANGQTGVMLKPAAAAGGSANIIGLFNAYNRVRATSFERDSTTSWTLNTTTWRVADNNSNNSISFIDGLGVINTNATFHNLVESSAANTVAGKLGINLNSPSATPNVNMDNFSGGGSLSNAVTATVAVTNSWYPVLGYNTVYSMENIGGSGTCTFNLDGTNMALTLYTEY